LVGVVCSTTTYVDGEQGSDRNSCLTFDAPCATIRAGDGVVKIAGGSYSGSGNTGIEVSGPDVTLTIQGQDLVLVTLSDASSGDRFLDVVGGATVTIEAVTFLRGGALGGSVLRSVGATLRLAYLTFSLSNTSSLNSTSSVGSVYAEDSVLSVDNCLFADTLADKGGAVYATSSSITVTLSTFSNCAAREAGGAIYADTAVRVVLNQTTFTGGVEKGPYDAQRLGGAVYVSGVVPDGDEGDDVVVVVEDCNFQTFTGLEGGALYVQRTLSLAHVAFSNCNASNAGGAVWVSNDSAGNGGLFVSDSDVDNCRATLGGGLHVTAARLNMSDTRFNGNIATGSGGGVWWGPGTGTASIVLVTFVSDIAGQSGGGMFLNGTGEGTAADIFDSVFSGNLGATGGGALAAVDVALDLRNGTFTDNKATASTLHNGSGGALYLSGSLAPVSIRSSVFQRNMADSTGGAVQLVETPAESIITACNFTDNVAEDGCGGAVHQSGGNCVLLDVRMEDGTAKNGAAACFDDGAKTQAEKLVVQGNTCPNGQLGWMSSAIAVLDGTVTAWGTFIGNTNDVTTGDLLVQSSAASLLVTSTDTFSASAVGGDLSVVGSSTLEEVRVTRQGLLLLDPAVSTMNIRNLYMEAGEIRSTATNGVLSVDSFRPAGKDDKILNVSLVTIAGTLDTTARGDDEDYGIPTDSSDQVIYGTLEFLDGSQLATTKNTTFIGHVTLDAGAVLGLSFNYSDLAMTASRFTAHGSLYLYILEGIRDPEVPVLVCSENCDGAFLSEEATGRKYSEDYNVAISYDVDNSNELLVLSVTLVEKSSYGAGAIVGIVLGVLLVIGIGAGLGFLFVKSRVEVGYQPLN